jgi:hypothetical protein
LFSFLFAVRTTTTDGIGIATEPEGLLGGIGLFNTPRRHTAYIQAKATDTRHSKAPREDQIYKINEEAKKKSWATATAERQHEVRALLSQTTCRL